MNKRLFVLALCAVLVMALWGCNSSEKEPAATETTATTAQAQTEADTTFAQSIAITDAETVVITTAQPSVTEVYAEEEPEDEAFDEQIETEIPAPVETEATTETPVVEETTADITYSEDVEDIPENTFQQGEGIVLPDDIW